MTNYEALQKLEAECKSNCCVCIDIGGDDCWKYNAKAALFYKIPAKPRIVLYPGRYDGNRKRIYCSHCRTQIRHNKNFKYCPRCGKAIDWEE